MIYQLFPMPVSYSFIIYAEARRNNTSSNILLGYLRTTRWIRTKGKTPNYFVRNTYFSKLISTFDYYNRRTFCEKKVLHYSISCLRSRESLLLLLSILKVGTVNPDLFDRQLRHNLKQTNQVRSANSYIHESSFSKSRNLHTPRVRKHFSVSLKKK